MDITEDKPEPLFNEIDNGQQLDMFGGIHKVIIHGKGKATQLKLEDIAKLTAWQAQYPKE